MVDVVSAGKRSQMMSGIRGRDTGPEIRVRRLLHSSGLRFRLHRRDLPGTPDIVLPRHRVVVFVHGCFWHFHAGCRLAKVPGSRPEFWRAKLLSNRARDTLAVKALEAMGWRVLVVWECWLRATPDEKVAAEALAAWIESGQSFHEYSGEQSASSDGGKARV